jgi:hypothetical protein
MESSNSKKAGKFQNEKPCEQPEKITNDENIFKQMATAKPTPTGRKNKTRAEKLKEFDPSSSESEEDTLDLHDNPSDVEISTPDRSKKARTEPVQQESVEELVEQEYIPSRYEYDREVRIYTIAKRMLDKDIIKEDNVPAKPVKPPKFSDELSDDDRKEPAVLPAPAPSQSLAYDSDDSDDSSFEYTMVEITKWEPRNNKAFFEVVWNNGKREPGEYKYVKKDDEKLLNAYLECTPDALAFCLKHHKHKQVKKKESEQNKAETSENVSVSPEKPYLCPEDHSSRIAYHTETNGGYFSRGGKYHDCNCDNCHKTMRKISVKNCAMICAKNVKGCYALLCCDCYAGLADNSGKRSRRG